MPVAPSGIPSLGQGQGIAPYLQTHLGAVIQDNDPMAKITPTGMLKLAIENTPNMGIPDHEKMRLNDSAGQYRNIQLWYYQRATQIGVSRSLDCVPGVVTDRSVFTLAAPFMAVRTIQIPNKDLQQYSKDAIQMVSGQGGQSGIMQEVMTQILMQCNALAATIDTDLIGAVVFGTNVVDGSVSRTINIPRDSTQFNVDAGISALLSEAQVNEFNGKPLIAGGGIMNAYQNLRKSAGYSLNGQNIADVSGYEFYYDLYAGHAWGDSNAIGVFAPGTIGFIDLNTIVGFTQVNLGTYEAFQLKLPVSDINGVQTLMNFDIRMTFNPCPTTVPDLNFPGGTREISEAWTIKISKQYGLFQTPAALYAADDRLAGNNGALKYVLTNV